jgi:hypothetical protein
MQTTYTGYIPRIEWRWVALVSLTLILIAFAPFVLITLRNSPDTNWRFLGLLHRFQTSTAYLARMEQGADGLWLVHFWHTPEAHSSALIQPIYPLLGQVARLTTLTTETIFHVARLFGAVFMYFAIYQLGANIWVRVRARRVFFIVASIGAGFGWLLATMGLINVPDLDTPQAFPFSATLVNVHYPLTIGCLALLAGILITAFRPGDTTSPDVRNMGLVTVLMSIALAFLYPESLAPLGLAVAGCVLAVWGGKLRRLLAGKTVWYEALIQATRHVDREARWGLWVLIPALPIIVYYLVTLRINPAVAEWVQQKYLPPPTLVALMLGFGLPLLCAVPGIYRAIREFNADTDRFMLLWLASMIVLTFMPFWGGRDLMTGMMLPVAYFAARSIEDVWLHRISRRGFRRAVVLLVPLIALSHMFTLIMPIVQPLFGNEDAASTLLEPDYVDAFNWLQTQTTSEDVILAAPDNVSAWIPPWVKARVVYGHPYETLHAGARHQAVLDWYRITDASEPLCNALLNNNVYRVTFVLNGPRERQIGDSACFENLLRVVPFGEVEIYLVP